MKKLLPAALALLAAGVLSAAPVLFEAYSEETITIPEEEIDTIPVVELSFYVDTSCYVLFTGGTVSHLAKIFLSADDTDLFPEAGISTNQASGIHVNYTYLLLPGIHTIHLNLTNIRAGWYADCSSAYLQALIFLSDEPDAVTEQTPEDNPQPQARSVVSRGPWISAPGATELVDATGRVIEYAIEEDKVFISNLSTGTYFARDGERTVVKIVKVE